MTTQFCSATIPLWDGLAFHLDGNSKVTRSNGSYDAPAPNAFSLPHVTTCPGSTERCRASCYVHGLKLNAPTDPFQLSDFVANWQILDASPGTFICTSASRPRSCRTISGRWESPIPRKPCGRCVM